jgi:hypothetical protein
MDKPYATSVSAAAEWAMALRQPSARGSPESRGRISSISRPMVTNYAPGVLWTMAHRERPSTATTTAAGIRKSCSCSSWRECAIVAPTGCTSARRWGSQHHYAKLAQATACTPKPDHRPERSAAA